MMVQIFDAFLGDKKVSFSIDKRLIHFSVIVLLLINLNTLSAQTLSGYATNGTAVNYGNGLIRMTPTNVANVSASAWNTTQHDLTQPFDLTVRMFFGCDNGPDGADGMTFQMHTSPNGTSSLGASSGFLGIIENTPSVAVEFDTWFYNPGAGFDAGDIAEDHITILQNGSVNNTAANPYLAGPVAVASNRDLEDCTQNANDYYTARFVWISGATQTLEVYEEGSPIPSLSYSGDMITDIFGGNTLVWWGFTASTGGGDNEQWIAPEGSIIPWQCETNSCCAPYDVNVLGEAPICKGDTIEVNVQGTYSKYSWSTGDTTSSIRIGEPGTYYVDVLQDQSGTLCPSTDTIIVLPSGPSGSFTGDATICNDGSTSTPLTVNYSGGGSPVTIEYSKNAVVQNPITNISSSPYIFNSDIGSGTYEIVSITDNSGCEGFIDGVVEVDVFLGLPEGDDEEFCPDSDVILNVTDEGGTYEWFNASSGGTSINTGASFNTPVLSSTTTYYVENTAILDSISKLSSFTGPITGGFDNYDAGLTNNTIYFTANRDFKIKSIDAVVNQWGATCTDIIIQLTDLTNSTVYSYDSANFCSGVGLNTYTLNVDFDLVNGHDYEIVYHSNGAQAPVLYDNFTAGYPINDFEEYTITGGASGDLNNRWPGLFNWIVSYPNPASSCGRTPVTATALTIPDVEVTNPAPVCAPSVIDLTSTWTDDNTSGGMATYHTSTPATSLNQIVDPTNISTSGDYYVKVGIGTCSDEKLIEVEVNAPPAVPLVVSSVSYCRNEAASPLSADALPGNTLNWYTVASGGTSSVTAPTPATNAVSTFYVSQETPEGCESNRASISVGINENPTASLESGNTFCPENLSGESLEVTVSSGVAPYKVYYNYNNGTTIVADSLEINAGNSGLIENTVGLDLGAGEYTLTEVVDNEGCKRTISGQVSNIIIHPTLTLLGPDVSCDPATNLATITATISGGVSSGFSVTSDSPSGSGSIIQSTGAFTGTFPAPSSTTFDYTLNDGTGCLGNEVQFDGPVDCGCRVGGVLRLASGSNTVLCPSEKAIIEVTVGGSSEVLPVYQATITDLTTVYNSISTRPGVGDSVVFVFEVDVSGTYSIEEVSDQTCTGQGMGSVNVTMRENVSFVDDLQNEVLSFCPGEDLSLNVQAIGTDVTYQWQKDNVDLSGERSSIFNLLGLTNSDNGMYGVKVVGACNDISSELVELVINDGPQIMSHPLGGLYCEGTNEEFLVQANGENLTYRWFKNEIVLPDEDQSILTLSALDFRDSGTFKVVVSGDCGSDTSNAFMVQVDETPNVNLVGTDSPSLEDEITVVAVHSGDSFSWGSSPNNPLVYSDPNNLVTTVKPINAVSFYVYFTSAKGVCSVTDSLLIKIRTEIQAPNVFTPNGDGDHDFFEIAGLEGLPDAVVTILNRWGGEVYSTSNYNSNPWNGEDVPDGVYYFVIELNDDSLGKGHSGVIHVIR